MQVLTGLDVLIGSSFSQVRGKRVGVLCNQASVASDFRHILDHLLGAKVEIGAIFGPQHGLWGHTQDNMIEWEGSPDSRYHAPVFSLYGDFRQPTAQMLEGLDVLLIDLMDVGARYYTFIWTMALCLETCARIGLPVIVLDRPNPIGGVQQEGTVLDPEYESFVGLYPLPSRHGLTIGEIAQWLKGNYFVTLDLTVVRTEGWSRASFFDETGLTWFMPSPNMPHAATAIVYTGGCLLEGTNLSEGRGTTRPFEIFGAPFINGWQFSERLNSFNLEGVAFRPIEFQPTFNKHGGIVCGGCFVHVKERGVFDSFLSYVAILQVAMQLCPEDFEWKAPPYEYEFTRLPIDVLAGNSWLRKAIESSEPLQNIRDRCAQERTLVAGSFKPFMLY